MPRRIGVGLRGYAREKPVSITDDGRLLTAQEATSTTTFGGGSLYSLDDDLQKKLVLKRIELDPRYDLGIMGVGRVAKDEVAHHVSDGTAVGRMVVRAELNYIEELLASLGNEVPELVEPTPTRWRRPDLPPWKKTARRVKLPLTNTALFCENTTDAVTKYAAKYRMDKVHPIFRKAGFNVVCLQGIDDTRANWVREAVKPLRLYVSGVGHGSATAYTGHLGERTSKSGGTTSGR